MVGLCIGLIFSLYLATIDVGTIRGWWHLIPSVIAIMLAAALAWIGYQPDLKKNALGKPHPKQPRLEDVEAAAQYVKDKYGDDAIRYFQNALLDLASYLVRVDQELSLNGRDLFTTTTLTFRYELHDDQPKKNHEANGADETRSLAAKSVDVAKIAKNDRKSILLPIVTARKGHLFDNFAARSSSGAKVNLISQYEIRGLLATAIQALFTQHLTQADGNRASLTPDQEQGLRDVMNDVLINAVCFVGNTPSRPGASFTLVDSRSETLADIDHKLSQWPLLFSKDVRNKITRICRVLTYNYLIVAEMTQPELGNFVVSYEHMVTSDLMRTKREELLRARFGLDPVTIDLPVSRAFQADSFHLQIQAPPGQYVFDHHLEELGSRNKMEQDSFENAQPIRPYMRLYHEEGRSIAHLYVRRQGAHPHTQLSTSTSSPHVTAPSFKSVIRFREIPPGSISGIALVSLMTSILIMFFTFARSPFNPTGTFQGAPALILALPAFVAAALGRGVDGRGLARSSLTVSIALGIVVLNSLLSVVFYILNAVNSIPGNVTVTLSFLPQSTLVSTNGLWLTLGLWSTATTIFIYKEKRAQTNYYLNMLTRSAVDNKKKDLQNDREAT
ncbi:hypothetical protein LFM09_14775 [Lentzea alba]|uniref:hypothetical protein n=1 Tax=Lentzea alba TaxID=2714351 RepID=UPI0039BF8501